MVNFILKPFYVLFNSCQVHIIPALIGAGAMLGSAGFNFYQQWKQNQYLKKLQKEVFEREDNAIQRQAADAEQAGFNKFSVMGNNGAGAGSVVSVTAPQVNDDLGGKLLDTLNAESQLAYNRASAEKAKAEAQIAENNKVLSNETKELYQAQIASDMVKTLRQNGINANFAWDDKGFTTDFQAKKNERYKSAGPAMINNFDETPLGMEFKNFYRNVQNQSDIMETNANWKEIQNIANIIGTALGGGSQAVNAGASLKRSFNKK